MCHNPLTSIAINKYMNYDEFISTFKSQANNVQYDRGLGFALKISRLLFPEYTNFCLMYQWGDPKVLQDSIQLCERAKAGSIDMEDARKMAVKLDAVTPHMDNYSDLIGSYALNACVVVYSSLQYLLNRDNSNLYDIGIAYTDTVDFKVQGEEDLTEDEIAAHPDMQKAWNFIVEETK